MLGAVAHYLAYYLKHRSVVLLLLLSLAVCHADHRATTKEAPACADELALALSASSAASRQRGAEVEQRRHDLGLARLGLSTVVSVQPSYSGERNVATQDRPAEWGLGMQLDANLKYRYDLVDQLRAVVALHKAELRYRDQRRGDVLLALVTFSRLRAAERAAVSAEQSATEAEKAVVESEGAMTTDASPVAKLDLREARLAAQRARNSAKGRHDDVANHLTILAELGVGSSGIGTINVEAQAPAGSKSNASAMPPAPESCHVPPSTPLLVPLAQLASNDTYIALLLGLELAEAQSMRASLAPLRDLALKARYQEAGNRTTFQVGLASGRPEASMEFRWRDVTTHAWSVGVSATLRLDDSMGAALSEAQDAVTAAAAALTSFEAGFSAALAQADAALLAAYQELLFAEEALAIATERLALAPDERDTSRAEQARLRTLDAYERAYQSYLRAINDHLSGFGLTWADL